jgi:hypothetical protein
VPRKSKRTADIFAAVTANVKNDWPATCKDITFAYGGAQWDKAQHSLRNQGLMIKEWFLLLEQNSGPHSRHHSDVDDRQQERSSCFSIPPICWIWLLRPISSFWV